MDDQKKSMIGHRLKRMALAQSFKSPISLLQEVLILSRNVPRYDFINSTGADHNRSFTYRAFINEEIFAEGTANTKKDAKTESAKNLMNYLISFAPASTQTVSSSTPILPSSSTSHTSITNNAPVVEAKDAETTKEESVSDLSSTQSTSSCTSPVTIKKEVMQPVATMAPLPTVLTSNAIGELQELCVGRAWELPNYVEESSSGYSHEPIFTTSCSVLSYKTYGHAGNKKAAKKLSAQLMLQKLLVENAVGVKQELQPKLPILPILPVKSELSSSGNSTVSLTAPSVESSVNEPTAELPPLSHEDVVDFIQRSLDESMGPDVLKLKVNPEAQVTKRTRSESSESAESSRKSRKCNKAK